MVVYTYRTPMLLFLNFLMALAELFDGLVGVLSLGMVHSATSYSILPKIAFLEIITRSRKMPKPHDSWPRIQIWPRRKS